ncbi:hypothetical protein [Burkholderia stagnalis]|uniref:hypothetical protein n=1 Tax=Burkholderia stagnalis TaxID=1503054 RepID=UPI00075F16F1|nr:hypothetical protein [Burkholderia stagnalis]KVO58572.1 hypothetical protein WT18_15555 [Burkholderia stagnalis]KVP10688.1 hypothetical protein WT20_17550 [Burkholderia stagnalis]KVW98316.1 hypothetical protein WT30_05325 [Burkholderia stagnalis]KWH83987.1 hypothetical protein WT66_06060 [Burkholderia stagnalis]KWK22356.1 hypothetical protein WT77_18495 [Burkholderia stagnalis]
MEALALILGLVSPLFIVVALVGLIRPSLFKNKKTGAVPKRATLFVGGIAAAMMTVTVGALILPKKDDATKAARHATASPVTGATAQAAPRVSLEITPEEFRRKYNRGLSGANTGYALPEFEIVHDTVYDGFQQSVGRGIELAGTINKADGSLRELMIQIGNDEPAVMLKAVSALVGIAAAVNPDATASKDDTETVVNMIQLAMESRKESKTIERSVGKLHYSAVASDTGGLLFGISPR